MRLTAFGRLPLWAHFLALAAVIVVVGIWVRPYAATTTDEGAAIVQARQLEAGAGWLIPPVVSRLDPQGIDGAYNNSDNGSKGRAYYAKHPAYPELLRYADRLAGRAGLFTLSMIGTLLAALASALLARSLFAKWERTSLWMTALGTSLWFYSFVVLAHTLAAGIAGLTMVIVLRSVRGRGVAVASGATLLGTAAVAFLRSEGLFLGPSIALTLVICAALKSETPRRQRIGWLITAACALVGSIAAFATEREITKHILGTPHAIGTAVQGGGFISGKVHGAASTLFSPSFVSVMPGSALLVLSGVFVLVAAFGARRNSPKLVPVCWAFALMAIVVAAVLPDRNAVEGWALAFPVGWFGVLSLRRSMFDTTEKQIVTFVVSLFTVGVLLTEYSQGGGYEWGGRYLSIVAPMVVPIVITASAAALVYRARLTAALMASTTIALSVLAVVVVHAQHRTSARAESFVREYLPPAEATYGAAGKPPVVWTQPFTLQVVWDKPDVSDWLAPDDTNTARVIKNLYAARQGVVIVMTPTPEATIRDLTPYYEVQASRTQKGVGLELLVAVRSG